MIGRFTTVDPLAEKYYSISPYVYVMNNPMRYIDPTGMDTLDIDHTGRLTNIRLGGSDVLSVTNSKGKVVSKTFEAGTFKEYGSKNLYDAKDGSNSYVYIQGDNADNTKSAFEFLADNTSVEWGNTTYLNSDNSVSHFITTSHNENMESGFSFLAIDKQMHNSSLLGYDHSHPGGPSYPSGLVGGNPRYEGKGDMGVITREIETAMQRLAPIPIFRVYTPGSGYRKFNVNSTQKQFNKMPKLYFER